MVAKGDDVNFSVFWGFFWGGLFSGALAISFRELQEVQLTNPATLLKTSRAVVYRLMDLHLKNFWPGETQVEPHSISLLKLPKPDIWCF